jgi:hypothetical protein
LVAAIASGGQLAGLLDALRDREAQLLTVEAQCAEARVARLPRAAELARIRCEIGALAASWRRVLADEPANARPIISMLLQGRMTFSPLDLPAAKRGGRPGDRKRCERWELRGDGTLSGLFSRELFPQGIGEPLREKFPHGIGEQFPKGLRPQPDQTPKERRPDRRESPALAADSRAWPCP